MQIKKWPFFVLPRKVNCIHYQFFVGNLAWFEKKKVEEKQEKKEAS